MHLLQTTASSLDDSVEPLDLGQTPGDIVVLSFADSDLAGLAAAYATERHRLPSVRLAHLRDLRHPMSIDLWIDKVGAPRQGDRGEAARRARLVALRRRGTGRRSHASESIALAVLPGEDRDDPRLEAASTLPPDELAALLAYFREGGRENLQALLRRLAGHAGAKRDQPAASTGAAHGRLSAGQRRGEPRCAGRRARAATARRADHLLPLGAARRRHRADRCRCARRWPRAGLLRRRW